MSSDIKTSEGEKVEYSWKDMTTEEKIELLGKMHGLIP